LKSIGALLNPLLQQKQQDYSLFKPIATSFSVLITRRYDPRDGCCAFTNVMIGVDTIDQARELISFLEDKIDPDIEKGNRKLGTFEGSQPALGLSQVPHATAPPSYANVQP